MNILKIYLLVFLVGLILFCFFNKVMIEEKLYPHALTGTLMRGVECWEFRSDRGISYSISFPSALLSTIHSGERAAMWGGIGHVASICMQNTVFIAASIQRIP